MTPLILVVDDNPGIRDILKMILEMEGYIVHTAGSGEETFDQIARNRPDLILLDLVMTPLDGWAVLERIRSDAKNDDIRVLMVTARPPTREEAEKYTSLVDGYIMKPFDVPSLLQQVSDVLSEKEKMGRLLGDAAKERKDRSFLEEYCRLSRIVRAQQAFSVLLSGGRKSEEEEPTREAVRLRDLEAIVRQVTGISETGE